MPSPPPSTGPAADPARAFRQAIEQDCAKRGWTYRQLASRTKYGEQHIWAIIEGRQRPTRKVARALDVVFGTGERYYQLWETFDQARQESQLPADRANPQNSRYPDQTTATTPPDSSTEDQTNRRQAVKTLGTLLLTGATRTRKLLREAESSNVGPLTLDEYDDAVAWLTRNSHVQPLPTLIETADRNAAEVADLLDGRHSGRQRLRLELLTAQLAFLQGDLAFRLGEHGIARTHLRLARHYGERLRSTDRESSPASLVLASIADVEGFLAIYQGRFDQASTTYRDAQPHATEHTRARLIAGHARALAGHGPTSRREVIRLLDQAEATLPARPTFEPGAVAPFGSETLQLYRATASVRVGHDQAEEFAQEAVRQYETLEASNGERFHYQNLALARLDLGMALVKAKHPEPEEAARLGGRALAVPPELRNDLVRRRTAELLTLLQSTPTFRDLVPVRELTEAARGYRPLAPPAPSRPALGSS